MQVPKLAEQGLEGNVGDLQMKPVGHPARQRLGQAHFAAITAWKDRTGRKHNREDNV